MKDHTVPLIIVSILADGKFHSSEQLSKCLNIDWKDIDKNIYILQNWGVDIFFVSEKGYKLLQPIQLLNEKFIHSHIESSVKVLPVIDSTNQYLLEHLTEFRPGDVCLAEHQQAGRGYRGRRWFSPFGTNLYLSMYWRLGQGRAAAAVGLSLVIGVVLAEVLQKVSTEKIRVKWPNDLYLQDRKLAGILIELKGNYTAQLVIGIGINLKMGNVQTKIINQRWISLEESGKKINRNILAVQLIKELCISLVRFEKEGLLPFLSRWRELDNFINRPVKLIIGDKMVYGISRGIDAQGALLLEQNGMVKPWFGNKISLRTAQFRELL